MKKLFGVFLIILSLLFISSLVIVLILKSHNKIVYKGDQFVSEPQSMENHNLPSESVLDKQNDCKDGEKSRCVKNQLQSCKDNVWQDPIDCPNNNTCYDGSCYPLIPLP